MEIPGMPEDGYHAILANHRTCNLDVVKKLASVPLDTVYSSLLGVSPGLVILSTCNRVEIYWYGPRVDEVVEAIRNLYLERAGIDVLQCSALVHGINVARHLFRVASGIESMLIGENEILGQVRQAMEDASRRGVLDPYLRLLFHRAIIVGKRVRRETRISSGAVSVPLAAVHVAEDELRGFSGKNIVVIGAGEAGEIIATAVAKKKPARLLILNRTVSKAKRLAEKIGAEWGGLDLIPRALESADAVFVAISGGARIIPEEIIHGRSLLIVDVSMPPVVPRVDGPRILWIDSLKEVARKNLERRRSEIPRVEAIVEEEARLFECLVRRKKADEVLSRIMSRAEEIRRKELERALKALSSKGIDTSNGASFIVEALSRSITRKVLQPLYRAAREAAERGDYYRLKVLLELFGGE